MSSDMNRKYLGFSIVILACKTWMIQAHCQQVNASSGIISDSYEVTGYNVIERCWKIPVAAHHFINTTIELPKFSYKEKRNCSTAYVEIKMEKVGSKIFCGFDNAENETLFLSSTDSYIELVFHVKSANYGNRNVFSFRLKYLIQPSVLGLKSINEARENAVSWLKRRHNPFWGWKEDTPRAVTALYLSGAAQFNGTLIEEMMAKQAELRTALALTWNSVSIERLSTFINALLTVCLKPRYFYGHDLVAKLKRQVESSGDYTHPAAYLALCNANETWPDRYISDLSYVLTSKLSYHLIRDLQAFAILALSCEYNRETASVENEVSNEVRDLKSLYYGTIKRMNEYQKHDGSFGNPHTTALFTQALIASDHEFAKNQKRIENIEYLMKELNSSGASFLSIYATLPLLNGKTLVDITRVNCSKNPRFEGEDPVSELKDNKGPKIRVQYFLYIGDQKDVIHTISLLVPKNSSAYRIMEIAALQDKKYEFKVESIESIKHVYEISGIQNDPEVGKFWLMYLKPLNNEGLSQYTNPERLILKDEEHLVMWYESQQM